MKQLAQILGVLARWLGVALLWAIVTGPVWAASPTPPAVCTWPAWQAFQRGFVSPEGRVIDVGSPQSVTTSEGQSYALFFALVEGDRATFDRVLLWTVNNLAQGDLTAHLPAWLWGKKDGGSWGVLDSNSASDSDVWIAYALLEAGRLWQDRRYQALGTLLARRIVREETARLPQLGPTLLPAPVGFTLSADRWRLNPSYVPLPVMRRLAAVFPKSDWPALADSSLRLMLDSAPKGIAPEWIEYHSGRGFVRDAQTGGEGSYNAIRVYLWAGMTASEDTAQARLLARFMPLFTHVAQRGAVPEKAQADTGALSENNGFAGFSAAWLPFAASVGRPDVVARLQQHIDTQNAASPPGYYNRVLTLFGRGWIEGRYRFAADGRLIRSRNVSCALSR